MPPRSITLRLQDALLPVGFSSSQFYPPSLSKNREIDSRMLTGALAYEIMVKHHIMAGLVLALVTTCPALSWADFVAKVVTVHDGDRLTIRHDGKNETIYLKDIDCPELKQPYGKQAKHVTAAFIGNRDVVVRGLKRDKQGRVSAEVLVQDGRNVGHELLKEGLAWWRRSASSDAGLELVEELARASHKGLWADSNPVPPWKWKDTKKTSLKYSN
jgi:micrococcal nuclease